MAKHLSDTQLADYRDDGFLFPLDLFPAEEAAHHRTRLEAAEARHGSMHYRVKPYLVMGTANEIARHPRLLDAVEDILGPDILLWDCAYVIKEANDPRFFSWHQDLTYWGLDSDALVSAWVALTPATRENGAMRFIPGSHRDGKRAHRDTDGAHNMLYRGQTLAEPVDESRAVGIVLAPGQASLHHGWAMHASTPNGTGDRRIALNVQYAAPSMRQIVAARETATLVRGNDRYGHFEAEPAFAGDFAPAAVRFQQRIEALKFGVYDKA